MFKIATQQIKIKNNDIGLSDQDIIDIVLYILKCKVTDIQIIHSDISEIETLENLYATLVIYFFNEMFDKRQIIQEYTTDTINELACIAGVINVYETVTRGSLTRGRVAQDVSTKSSITEVNEIIRICLTHSYKVLGSKTISSIRHLASIKINYKDIFDNEIDIADELKCKSDIEKYNMISVITKYQYGRYNQDYRDYYRILESCKLLILDRLINPNDKAPENYMNQLNTRSLMEEFTRTACLNITATIKNNKGKKLLETAEGHKRISISESNPSFQNLELDILMKSKDSIHKDIIIDVKTNTSLTSANEHDATTYLDSDKQVYDTSRYAHQANVYQIYSYHNKWESTHKQDKNNGKNIATLFHYISNEQKNVKDADKFNKTHIIWNKEDNLRIYVYVIQTDEYYKDNNTTITQDIEEYIREMINDFIKEDEIN